MFILALPQSIYTLVLDGAMVGSSVEAYHFWSVVWNSRFSWNACPCKHQDPRRIVNQFLEALYLAIADRFMARDEGPIYSATTSSRNKTQWGLSLEDDEMREPFHLVAERN